ncbi:MAG: phosphopantothenoylcysteine decarboxylase [Microthrixaceae bacterium]
MRSPSRALASEPVRRPRCGTRPDPIPHTRLGQARRPRRSSRPATARLLVGVRRRAIPTTCSPTRLLATRAPVVVCPAMHTEMWEHPAVQDNLATLAARGVHVVPPEEGRLAGGDVGAGRLAEPERPSSPRSSAICSVPGTTSPGLDVLVTAGGTREPIDPVRFIGNRSSGKQGHAIADEAVRRGARGHARHHRPARPVPAGVAGECRSRPPAEMQPAVIDRCGRRPTSSSWPPRWPTSRPCAWPRPEDQEGATASPSIVLEPDPRHPRRARRRPSAPGQTLVGFAAETDRPRGQRRRASSHAKGVDLIVANDVSAPGVGFEHDTNAGRDHRG